MSLPSGSCLNNWNIYSGHVGTGIIWDSGIDVTGIPLMTFGPFSIGPINSINYEYGKFITIMHYQCSSCRRYVSAEDVNANKCSHCGV